MLIEFVQAAMGQAKYEMIANGAEPFYGKIPPCKGVWATGSTLEACRGNLQDALDGWIAVRLRRGLSIPVIGGKTVKPPVRLHVGGKT